MLYMYNSIEIEAIKLAVHNLKLDDYSCKETLLKSIAYLGEKYVINEEKEYLKKAVWHMYAYFEMGFPIEEGREVFQRILDYLKLDSFVFFPIMSGKCQRVFLNKTNVRNLLGKWNPVLHSMKITDVVNDIIYKVINRTEGEHLYHCGKKVERSIDEKLWEQTYRLYICKSISLFHDINRNRYYILEEKCKND